MKGSFLFQFVDNYTIQARLLPAFLIVLPVILVILVWFWVQISLLSGLLGLVVSCGGVYFLGQLGRDKGKQKEDGLFKSWGGKPTTVLLRHRNCTNLALLTKRHQKLEELIPGTKIPTAFEEKIDPKATDEIYDACITFLRSRTRDNLKFPLVYNENCNYGFRRNLWGLKYWAIVIAIGSLISIAFYLWFEGWILPTNSALVIVSGLLIFTWLLFLLTRITPDWVKIPAFAYAERLLEALEDLKPEPVATPR